MTVLCADPTCAIPRRHKDTCTVDICRGCQPGHAADGAHLCATHTTRIATNATIAAQLYDELALRLLAAGSPGDKVSGTADNTRLPNPAAVETRATIRHVLASWCRLISEQRGFTLPADDVHAMAAYVGRNASWLAATDYADEVSVELHDLRRSAWRLAYPSGARTITLAPCPAEGCSGTVKAIVRPADSLLPSELACDTDAGHRWPAGTWHSFRRAVKAAAA